MLVKSIVTAAAITASLVLLQPQAALAKKNVDVDINIGVPGPGYYNPGYPVYPGSVGRISCWQGVKRVQYRGFYNVKPLDCGGKFYSYRARRGPDVFRITVNSFSGRVVGVRPLY